MFEEDRIVKRRWEHFKGMFSLNLCDKIIFIILTI